MYPSCGGVWCDSLAERRGRAMPRRLRRQRPRRVRDPGAAAPASRPMPPARELEGDWMLVGFEAPGGARKAAGFLRYDRFANISVHAELAADEPSAQPPRTVVADFTAKANPTDGQFAYTGLQAGVDAGRLTPDAVRDGGVAALRAVGRHVAAVARRRRGDAGLPAVELGRRAEARCATRPSTARSDRCCWPATRRRCAGCGSCAAGRWTRPTRRGSRTRRPFREVAAQLTAYFAGRLRAFDVPVDPGGTPFQSRVWRALQDIPYGETESYGALARRIGDVKAVRAVGLANGANPISIIIPCHRVIGSNGSLIGYGGGLPTKRALLALEQGQGALI